MVTSIVILAEASTSVEFRRLKLHIEKDHYCIALRNMDVMAKKSSETGTKVKKSKLTREDQIAFILKEAGKSVPRLTSLPSEERTKWTRKIFTRFCNRYFEKYSESAPPKVNRRNRVTITEKFF